MGSEPDDKREIIQLTLQNLSLNHGKLEYTLQKPFDSIFYTTKSLKWGIKHYRTYFLSDVILLEFKIMLKKRYGRTK